MAIKKETTLARHQEVKKEFEKLNGVRELGVKKYSEKYIYAKVGEKFYLSPKTVENIVWNRVK
jgi:hypothetical protein